NISANWVLENVSRDDTLLNFLGNNPGDNYKYPQYKDFMPANRAGGFYHSWNIMALFLCMDPDLALRAIAMHINPNAEGQTGFTEYGKQRDVADINVAKKGSEVAALANRYRAAA